MESEIDSGVKCPECEKLLTDSVTLKCGHRFCKDCLKPSESASEGATSLTTPTIPCPLCQAAASLREEGLAIRRQLSNVLEQRKPPAAGRRPLCNRCETNQKAAVNFCTTCATRFCKECLEAFHPSEGPLARHVVISLGEYLPENTCSGSNPRITVNPGIPDGGDVTATRCRFHDSPLDIYCSDCELRICTGCVDNHKNHKKDSLKEVYDTRKDALEKEALSAKELSVGLKKIRSDIVGLQREIKRRARLEEEEIEANFDNYMNALQSWRQAELAKIEEKKRQEAMEALANFKAVAHEKAKAHNHPITSGELLSGDPTVCVEVSEGATANPQAKVADHEVNVSQDDQEESSLKQDSGSQSRPDQLPNGDSGTARDE